MMKVMGATTLLTFEEFERLPDEPGKMELLDEEPIRLPPAKLKYTRIIHWLQAQRESMAAARREHNVSQPAVQRLL